MFALIAPPYIKIQHVQNAAQNSKKSIPEATSMEFKNSTYLHLFP
jgi:hypothetical protein